MSLLRNIVKHSKLLYNIYYYVGSAAIKLLKLFLTPDSKLIVFNSFGGRKYDDSPKAIYLEMLNDPRFADYKLVWAFVDPEKFIIPKGKIVKIDSVAYYKAVLKARVWVTNTTMTRALNFTGINTYYLNSWHGSAIKKIGIDAVGDSVFVSKGKNFNDVFLAQSEYDRQVFSHAFGISPELIEVTGLPRNDELVCESSRADEIRAKLGIPTDKKVILYAPTFRDYAKDGADCVLTIPFDINKWQEVLGDQFVLLLRAHHAVAKSLNIQENEFIKDVSTYPHLNDLMIASDMLISDYSSIFFDYAIQGKPMFCFAYDYDEYARKRGVYFDIREELDNMGINTEDKLISAITNMDEEDRIAVTKKFRDKYVEKYGTATHDTLNLINNAIK